jgi:hypothetical protein
MFRGHPGLGGDYRFKWLDRLRRGFLGPAGTGGRQSAGSSGGTASQESFGGVANRGVGAGVLE